MGTENDWDITKPVDHTLISDIPDKIRDVKSSAKIIISVEHVTPATDNAGGQHLHGTARVYLQSALPTTDPEGNSLATTVGPSTNVDHGRLAVLTGSDYLMKVYLATSAGVSTGWNRVTVEGLVAATNIDANNKVVVNLATGTVSGNTISVQQIDTTYFKLNTPATTGELQVKVSTGLATSHGGGIYVSQASTDGYTPASCTTEQSMTLPNNRIFKCGSESVAAYATDDVTFNTAFPGNIVSLSICYDKSVGSAYNEAPAIRTKSGAETSIIQVHNPTSETKLVRWEAWGY